ncbi:MAG: hypothetical protein GAK43_02499 [Stenotrophomonas maltophilia]|nr:MAG: hypothetical protein GAK43_02499 [Stenotrophomonas maltophilia]
MPRHALRRLIFAFAALSLGLAAADARALEGPVTARPANWASPVDSSINLYRLSPTLYRSGLPGQDNVAELQQLGVHTVLSFIKDDDRVWIGQQPIKVISYPTHADRADDADVLAVLRLLQQAQADGPVLMHCKHGQNRTGLFAAMYRTVVEGWSKDEALREMHEGGFGEEDDMREAADYVTHADIPALRQALADGRCSTSALAACNVQRWLVSVIGGENAEANPVEPSVP